MKELIVLTVVFTLIIFCSFLSFQQGYSLGEKIGKEKTNLWWIQEKSIYKDTRSVLKKRILQKHNLL